MKKIKTICIIDDDEIYSAMVKKLIEQQELAERSLFFCNGKVALEYLSEYSMHMDLLPDLILLDLNMPVLDGWQFMTEFIKLHPKIIKEIPIFIVTSSINHSDHQQAKITKGISGLIIKPIMAQKLKEIIETLPLSNTNPYFSNF